MSYVLDNCRLEREDRELLTGLPDLPYSFRTYGRPDEIRVDWHKTENQGRMGSCRGHSGTSGLERLQLVKHRGDASQVKQLSEIFFYLATQKIDGLLGRDVGSTISGGLKLVLGTGCPEEALTGYPTSYPDRGDRSRILSRGNYEAGDPFKAKSAWKVPEDPEEAMNFIGGGGVIDFGVSFWQGMIPRDRVVRSFRPPSRTGGHAMVALGYTREGNLEAVNSHGDGPYLITPDGWRQMVRHQRSAFVGYIGSDEPEPVDWLSQSPYFD